MVFEAFTLIDGIVQFAVRVGKFFTIDHQFKTLCELGIGSVLLGERRHFLGIVRNEGGLDVLPFALLPKNLVDELAFSHARSCLNTELFANPSQLIFVHTADVNASMFLYGL